MKKSNVASSMVLIVGALVFSGTAWGQPRRLDVTRPNGKAAQPPVFGGALVFDAPLIRQPPGRFILVGNGDISSATTPRVDFRQALTLVLEDHLQKRIGIVDRGCSLTDDQKQKLQLAGRGDIHRVVEQIPEARLALESEIDDAAALLAISAPFRSVFDSRPPNDGTLFAKTSRTILTADQFVAYERLIPSKPAAAVDDEKQKTVVVNLRSVDTADLAAVLKNLFAEGPLRVESRPPTMLVITGGKEQVATCLDLLQQIDRMAPARRAN